MAIRLSGLQSGLDTETLVAALVSGYTLQKDNLVKAQTKLTWKKEAWKSMNTSIYSFYSGKLSSARMSSTYSLKKASVSDSTKAAVTASSSAVNGTQTLRIKTLATTGYLTGGIVKNASDSSSKISGSSKLSDMTGGTGNGSSITVTSEGKSTEITLSDDMTVNQFIAKMKDAGVNASFDETNQRFFVSSKTSGASHDFTITANSSDGLSALQSLGLYTYNDTEMAEYKKWASYGDDSDEAKAAKLAAQEEAYAAKEIKAEDRAKTYASKYNAAVKSLEAANEQIEKIKENDTVAGADVDTVQARAENLQANLKSKYSQYATEDDDGNVTYDTSAMSEDELAQFKIDKSAADEMTSTAESYKAAEDAKKAAQDTIDETEKYVTVTDGKAVADPENEFVKAQVEEDNKTVKADAYAAVEEKIAQARAMYSDNDGNYTGQLNSKYTSTDNDAVRIVGEDAEIYLNGAKYVNNTNTFAINGLTIEATATTKEGEDITVTTNTDIDGIYNSIKSFFKEYNTLITAMDTAYNADSSSGYEPLTDDEKDAMSDDEVEKWETKIKDSLLRKDSTLGNASSSMKNLMAQSIEINGKKYSLASFGIKTQDYFSAGTNEKGVYHIDGDSDDSVSSGNDDKLRAMIASDPDTVVEFFSQLTQSVYKDLGNRMATSTLSSSFTIYNDKQMDKEYSTYTTKISDKETEISTWEDYYYDKFSSMESALATLNSQQSALSGYFS